MTRAERYYIRASLMLFTIALAVNMLAPIYRGTWGYGLGYVTGWVVIGTVVATVAAGFRPVVRWLRSDDGRPAPQPTTRTAPRDHAERPHPRRPVAGSKGAG